MKRQTTTPPWAVGMRKLGPGVYIDAENVMHVSEGEICQALGISYTDRNSQLVEEAVRAEIARWAMREKAPAPAIERKVDE